MVELLQRACLGAGALLALAACQALSGVDDLTFAAGAAAGVAGAGGSAGNGGAAGESGSSGAPSCDPTAPFGVPTPLDVINDGTAVRPWVSDDLGTIFFSMKVSDQYDLFSATLDGSGKPTSFGPMGGVNDPLGSDIGPATTADGATLVFASDRAAIGKALIYRANKGSSGQFEMPEPIPAINDPSATITDGLPSLTGDGALLYFRRGPTSLETFDIWVSERIGDYQAPKPVTGLDTAAYESFPTVSSDGLTIYFASDRAGGLPNGGIDIWVAERSAPGTDFETAKVVLEVSSIYDEFPGWISPDGCTLYLHRAQAAANWILVAKRP